MIEEKKSGIFPKILNQYCVFELGFEILALFVKKQRNIFSC